MAKSVKERVSAFRKRLKANPVKYEAYKQNERKRKQKARRKEKKTADADADADRKRKLNRERVRRFRARKKKEEVEKSKSGIEEPVYKTPQALGKAVSRVKPVLPHSPRKRKAVVMKLANSEGITAAKKMRIQGSPNCIPVETVQIVESFFLLDSVSRQAPGKRDFVTVRVNGKKQQIQKRHLLWSLEETYALFKKEHSSVKIGFSKFCTLRPQNVLLSGQYPHQVCLCPYHENIRLLCDCLSKSIPDFPTYSGQFVDCFVCSPDSEVCMLGQCDKCPQWLETVSEEDLSLMVTWYQWERVVQKTSGKENHSVVKKMEKVCKEGTVDDALAVLKEKLPNFLKHVYIKRQQSKYFEHKIKHLQADEAVVQVDFSENYTCQQQDEVQTAHWNQEQVTIFPVAIWTINDDQSQKTCRSQVFITDDKNHDKKAVAVFMDRVLQMLVSDQGPKLKHVHVFSDGPSSQFKNRYMVNFYHKLRSVDMNLSWHFFATSHGKGVVDGIGGTVKRVVWRAVSSRRVPVVADAVSFAKVASELCKAVKVSFISSEELDRSADLLGLSTCFQEAEAIPGISQYHCIEPQESGQVRFRIYSSQPDYVELGDPHKRRESDSEESDNATTSGLSDLDVGDENYNFDSGDEEITTSEDNHDDDSTDEEEDDSGDDSTSDQESADGNKVKRGQRIHTSSAAIIKVQHCLPQDVQLLFDVSKPFFLPYHLQYRANAIANGVLSFHGQSIINDTDLKALLGASSVERDNWLSNFVIDHYLEIMRNTYSKDDFKIKIITWERFERAVGIVPAREIWEEGDSLWHQDIVYVPCNSFQSEHWFGLAVMPKKKQMVTLDSKAGDFVKPTIHDALLKMGSFLVELDETVDLSEWIFFSNRKQDVPQQANLSDCGVYTCLFARCLFSKSQSMITAACGSIPQFRKGMIIELHMQAILPSPPEDIVHERYYAVEYEKKFYFGRAVSVTGDKVEVKFLHQAGVQTFDWPMRNDLDTVFKRRVFYGPIELHGTGPFHIPTLAEITKLFKHLRKQPHVFK